MAPSSPRKPRGLNLAVLVPALPVVTLPNGKAHQLVPLTARGYELVREAQAMVQDERADMEEGRAPTTDVEHFHTVLDEAVAWLLPSATPDDRASLGLRADMKMAICLTAAGQIDEVVATLNEQDEGTEGNETARSSPLSGPGTTSARRSRRSRGATGNGGTSRSSE